MSTSLYQCKTHFKEVDKGKHTSFIHGAFILAIASFLSRVPAAVYKIPLTRLIGDEGMELYQMTHAI